jgi:hypothetical protein
MCLEGRPDAAAVAVAVVIKPRPGRPAGWLAGFVSWDRAGEVEIDKGWPAPRILERFGGESTQVERKKEERQHARTHSGRATTTQLCVWRGEEDDGKKTGRLL